MAQRGSDLCSWTGFKLETQLGSDKSPPMIIGYVGCIRSLFIAIRPVNEGGPNHQHIFMMAHQPCSQVKKLSTLFASLLDNSC